MWFVLVIGRPGDRETAVFQCRNLRIILGLGDRLIDQELAANRITVGVINLDEDVLTAAAT